MNTQFLSRHVFLSCLLLFPVAGLPAKLALVIGNGEYKHAERLPNPVNDARAVSRRLKKLGFHVYNGVNLSQAGMKKLLRKFSSKLNKKSVVVFYYAGHGIQKEGRNFLIPVNADINHAYEVEYTGTDLNMILNAFNEAKPRLTIALVDACRDNPFEKRIKGKTRNLNFRGEGLAPLDSIRGTVLSYATAPGNTAVDGYGAHSPYTAALLQYLGKPDLSVQEMLNEVGLAVMTATHGDQKPWFSSSPISRFCFGGCRGKRISRAPLVAKNISRELRVVSRLKKAMERGDLKTIRRLAELTEQQDLLLRNLFDAYARFSVSTLVPTRSVEFHRQGDVTVNITEAVNRKGNRVIPSEKWNYISFKLKKSSSKKLNP